MSAAYLDAQWFRQPGAYVLVDGQFGSTGKGLFAGYLADFMKGRVNKITTNAGPNSGHTAYYPKSIEGLKGDDIINSHLSSRVNYGVIGFEKIVTQQLPVASVFLDKMGRAVDTIINAGAIIDHDIMLDELSKWCNTPGSRVLIHPNAALINEQAKSADRVTTAQIASTGKGIGPAMAGKMARIHGKEFVASRMFAPFLPPGYVSWDNLWNWNCDVVFVETAQGFSLGLNSARFYPHVTSRECTVGQALADARIPSQMLRKVVATFRTYPIRVGNTENSSGEWYPDQREMSWQEIGVKEELTTVTKRVRRVASFSRIQFAECIAANRPDVLFLNFCNYMDREQLSELITKMYHTYRMVMHRNPEAFFLGFGPLGENITTVDEYYRSIFGRPLG